MAVIQWIGVAITIIGLVLNQPNNPSNTTQIIPQNQTQQQGSMQYLNINIAFDHATGRHYFQHLDGRWYEYPPRP